MLLAEELMLLSIPPGTGRTPFGGDVGTGLAGALISELLLEDRATIRGGTLCVTDSGRGRGFLDQALSVLASKGSARVLAHVRSVETALFPLHDRVGDRLVASGILRQEIRKTMVVFTSKRYIVIDAEVHRRLHERVRRDLLVGYDGFDPRVACVVALLEACQLLGYLIPDHEDERRVLPWIQAAQEADPVAMAVREIVSASQMTAFH